MDLLPPIAALMSLTVLCAATAIHAEWKPPAEAVAHWKRIRPAFNFDEANVPEYVLPDPLRTADGRRVETPEQWSTQREHVLELFREHMYGRSPGRPERLRFEQIEHDPQAMDGQATLKRIRVHSDQDNREHTFELILFTPNDAPRPVPVFLLLNHRSPSYTDPTRQQRSDYWPAERAIERGYGMAALQTDELAADSAEHHHEGVKRLFEGEVTEWPGDAWGTLAAWAWGASRALDYFETDAAVDASQIAVVGHSRSGKAALWAGAEDERFALVVPNNSGSGGASLTRRDFGQRLGRLLEANRHWFCGNLDRYRGEKDQTMPVDQHMLLALIAPRGLYVASADEDLWADPHGEFLALAHASPVYALWGHAPIDPEKMPSLDQPLWVGSRGYHIRRGGHGLTLYDWERFMDFADRLFKGQHDRTE